MRLQDLSPRRRQIVLHLWEGYTPKQVANLMGIQKQSVTSQVHVIAAQLPGQGSNMQKLCLWRSQVVLEALPESIKNGLKPLLDGGTLPPTYGQPPEPAGHLHRPPADAGTDRNPPGDPGPGA